MKEAILLDALHMTKDFLGKNLIGFKEVQSYAGKVMHIAGVIPMVRPFLSDIYAALYKPGHASGCIWTKQLKHVLVWIRALLSQDFVKLTRSFSLAVHLRQGSSVEFNLDASPWGMGGFLSRDGHILSWFAVALSDADCENLDIEIGASASQQAVEALAVLIALRIWAQHWQTHGTLLRVKSDSITALTMALKLQASGHATSIVAREIALEVAAANYYPVVAMHVPGIANVIPDQLSRRFQPNKEEWKLPSLLADVPEKACSDQVEFRSLLAPAKR